MCAGISFDLDKIDPAELDRFLLPDELKKSLHGDTVEVFFWNRQPFLPIEEEGGVHLYDWGNREPLMKMPKTGWAKIESVQDGKWDYLAPKIVKVPSLSGYEKKKWFKTPDGIKALKVRYHNVVRVYILTQKATHEFIELTHHDRMPISAKHVNKL